MRNTKKSSTKKSNERHKQAAKARADRGGWGWGNPRETPLRGLLRPLYQMRNMRSRCQRSGGGLGTDTSLGGWGRRGLWRPLNQMRNMRNSIKKKYNRDEKSNEKHEKQHKKKIKIVAAKTK